MNHPTRPRWFAVLVVVACVTSARADKPADRKYELDAPPLTIFDRLEGLKLGDVPRLPDDERKLLLAAWGRKEQPPAEVEADVIFDAMLFASGVEEAEPRRKYRERFDALLADAKAAVKDAKTDRDRGEGVMNLLHATVMKKGYEGTQTSLAAVFDTGTYNCVSASAMYYLVASRVGLKLQGISIPGSEYQPGHASLDLIDGPDRVQIEPTNPDRFDWAAKLKRPGVQVIGVVPDREKGHAVDALGIAAMIYSNRGVALAQEKPARRLAAARCYLAALALDPTDGTASKNLLSVFVNWGPDLMADKKYEDAVRALAFGLSFAPKAKALQNNHHVAWEKYLDAAVDAGDDPAAVALIARAAKAVPTEKDFRNSAHWFIRAGQRHAQAKDWACRWP
ncbi:hypothetical protein [Limnoglobus roseus]|uniref:Protein SirB1 N-terminal domain-containing protein n=1 Tax=Limnoglobus roseus TaxID=2598579 RepID=A0A5C1ANX9_9BACT|nr:hypothetical protein [Limnoglobus roseus]QEL18568.1 hypothetical protein PX52LOC_05600 [Limnoglobus roseus]